MRLDRAHIALARLAIRLWPFSFGHVHLMGWLDPPKLPRELITTPLRGYPVRLKYDPSSYIGWFISYRGLFEEKIIKTMARYLRPGMTFIDIGANVGQHTCIAAHMVGPRGRVIAIEPRTPTRALLEENISLNGFKNVTVLRCAIGEAEETASLYNVSAANDGLATLRPYKVSENMEHESVAVRPLSQVMSEIGVHRADVIKIDVEGAEMAVLKGAAAFIRRNPPQAMLIECMDEFLQRFDSSSLELMQCLASHGYGIQGLVSGRWRSLGPAPKVSLDLLATSQGSRRC